MSYKQGTAECQEILSWGCLCTSKLQATPPQPAMAMTEDVMRAQYDDVWERRDVLGVHPQKQEGFSWVGACVPTGRIFPDDLYAFADVCEK